MIERQDKIDRRNFLKSISAAGLGSVLASSQLHGMGKSPKPEDVKKQSKEEAKKEEPKYPQVPRRRLNYRTEETIPVLSLGAMFNVAENQIMLRKSLELGVNYWDTANSYAEGMSEIGIGQFLSENPEVRKNVFITSKASGASSVEEIESRLQLSLKRMNTSYIDLYYGVHGLNNPADLTEELRRWSDSAKERKLIRYFGFSTHKNMAECLMAASKLKWIDVIMTSYNYRLMQQPDLEAAAEACYLANMGLIAMKVQGRGQKIETKGDMMVAGEFLRSGYSEGQAKIKAVLQDKRISSACVGMKSAATLMSNAAAVLDKKMLSKSEMSALKAYAEVNCDGYCAGCASICDSVLSETPYVSDVMRYLMYYNSYGEREMARELFAQIPGDVRNKLLSIDYSVAQSRCPQRLAIGKLVSEAVEKLA